MDLTSQLIEVANFAVDADADEAGAPRFVKDTRVLALLRAGLKRAFRGLPRPLCVAARVWPKQIAGTPYHDGPAIGRPELAKPISSLRGYWQTQVVGSKGLMPGVVPIDVPYLPAFHYGLGDFEELGIAMLRQRVLELEGG